MGLAVHREPLVAGELLVGDGGAGRRAEDLRAAAGEARDAGVLHRDEHVTHAHALDARQVRHLDRGERLDVHAGVSRGEPAEHLQVIRQTQLGMQAAHDVKLAGGVVAGGFGLGEHFVERAGVRAVLPGHPRERTEHARVAQDAHVGGVDVLVGGEGDAVAVLATVRLVRQAADGEEVVRAEQRERVVARQAFVARDLVRDRVERGIAARHAARRIASVTLCPPNPNEFERATSTDRLTALLGAESRSQAGSGWNWLMVGGITPRCTTSAHTAASRAPAAPSRWPVIDLVEPKISRRAWSRNTAFTAAVSAASPWGVEVPCALM